MDAGVIYTAEYAMGTMGHGRGIGFLADDSFRMTSFGMDLNVLETTGVVYRYDLYSSTTGHEVGGLLATTSFTLGAGAGYRDVDFVYDFLAGSSYVINFSRADGYDLAWGAYPDGVYGVGAPGTHYSWEGTESLIDYGVLTMKEGFEGAFPTSGNPLIAHTRMSYTFSTERVPDHAATVMLVGIALAALGAMRRRTR